MIRGKTLHEVVSAFEAVGPQEEAEGAIPEPYNIPFEPKGRPVREAYRRNTSTLQVGSFHFETWWRTLR